MFATCWALGGVYRQQRGNEDDTYPIAAQSNMVETWVLILLVICAICALAASISVAYVRRIWACGN